MKNYIPKDKHDQEAVEYLQSIEFEYVLADIPELLEWMQDMHWPVAYGISQYLIPYIGEIKEELLVVLKSEDVLWVGNIIRCLFAKSADIPDDELLVVIKRIADHPTQMEINEGVDEDAREFIQSIERK